MARLIKLPKRLLLVLTLVVFTLSSIMLSACSNQPAPAATYQLTYSFWGNPKESMARVAEKFIDEVQTKSNNRVRITYYAGGALTTATTSYYGVTKNMSSMALVMMTYNPGRFPLTQAWHLPLGFTTAQAATEMKTKSIEVFDPVELKDTKLLYVFSAAPTQLLTKSEINSLEDLRGKKIRCDGSTAALIAKLGATPVSMSIGDVYEALQKGIVDGTVNVPGVLFDFKFEDFINYMQQWNLNVQTMALVMNQDKWDSLPADIQQIFENASAKYMHQEVDEWNANDVRGLESAMAKGMKIKPITPEIKDQLQELFKPLYEDYVQKSEQQGLPGQEFLDFCLDGVK
jgi:TRAP-type C4-dicarboxylate transport system substrate-binding protein